MADELQALLDRIQQDGLAKAEAEKEQLLTEARQEAARLVATAKQEAEHLVAEAKRNAELQLEKGRETLGQAARDVLLSLRERLQERLAAVAKQWVGAAVTPEVFAQMLLEIVRAYVAKGGAVDDLSVLLPEADQEKLAAALGTSLWADLKAKPELSPVPDISAGFRVVFNQEDVAYDFTDEALAESLAAFLNPRLAELIRGNAD